MKILTWIVGAIVVMGGIWYLVTAPTDGRSTTANLATTTATIQGAVRVTPISHATAVLSWDNVVMYVDPVGGTSAFAGQPTADIILVTDIHSDHLSTIDFTGRRWVKHNAYRPAGRERPTTAIARFPRESAKKRRLTQ